MPICDEHPIFSYRVIEYVGKAYQVAAVVGSVFYFIKGLRSPSAGRLDAVAGGVLAAKANVPRFVSLNAAYAGVFCAVESAVSRAGGRDDDHWDMVAAGAATSGFFSLRRGAAATARSAFLGATAAAGVGAFILCVDRHIACIQAPTYRPLPVPVTVTSQDEKGAADSSTCDLSLMVSY
jgi:mitochondrial import inner membrane translocase subunit TIM17